MAKTNRALFNRSVEDIQEQLFQITALGNTSLERCDFLSPKESHTVK